MRILLLSAYDAASHRRWREGLVAAMPEHDWTVLTLPARYFNWRIRGNSLSWAFEQRERLSQAYDLLVATSMTDLSALRGLVPAIAAVPTLVYFHENQFAYPPSAQQFQSIEPQVLNLYTALAADHIAFNSAFNRDSFLQGAASLLKKMPDRVPPGITATLQAKSSVLPVPLEPQCFSLPAKAGTTCRWQTLPLAQRSLRILWAARFEYDKGGELLLHILRGLVAAGIDFELALLGQQFRHSPKVFARIEKEFAAQLVAFGFEPSAAVYQQYLQQADMVLSTALHEFQGLAVLEAVAAGCVPVLPSRQCYPSMYAPLYCYATNERVECEAAAAVERIQALQQGMLQQRVSAPDVSSYSWAALLPQYQQRFAMLCHGGQAREPLS
jgi:glycosyltransferase involved in cell wall biosynthesis